MFVVKVRLRASKKTRLVLNAGKAKGMKIYIYSSEERMAAAAAEKAALALRSTVEAKGKAVFVAATGASQLQFLKALTSRKDIPWAKTIMFHLDEYIGLSDTHPASFRYYLRKHLVDIVHPGEVHFIRGDAEDPLAECRRLSQLITQYSVDVAFVGIGENCHLAFNDPPADFDTNQPFIVVNLDYACRFQQVREGWFSRIEDVPLKAITMSIKQILRASVIIGVVPEARKAQAVKNALEGPVSPHCPASILRTHGNCHLFLDKDSSSMLNIERLKYAYEVYLDGDRV
jgi:glucosamine-6-phosphate deaminase